jgi:hypothetical protein
MLGLADVRGFRHLIGGLGLLIVGVMLLGGCSLFGVSSGPKTYSTANDLVEFTRTVPEQVQAGSVFTVQVIIKAKVDLQLAAVSEQLPVGFLPAAANDQLTALGNALKAGDQVKLTYHVQASSQTGTFQLWGKARALQSGQESVTLMLGSPVKVAH